MSMMREDQPSAQTLSTKLQNSLDAIVNPPSKSDNVDIKPKYKEDLTRTMRCCQWRGKESMQVVTSPAPAITEPGDAIVKVTTTLICGSDLHMYHDEVSCQLIHTARPLPVIPRCASPPSCSCCWLACRCSRHVSDTWREDDAGRRYVSGTAGTHKPAAAARTVDQC